MTRVLLVFADPALGAELAAALAAAGLKAQVVTSGERAMDRFIQAPSDVVVVDYDLGGRDGLTTTEAIRWMPGGRRARVVLTAAQDPDDGPLEQLAENLDVFAVLVGPHDRREIVRSVQDAAVVPTNAETRVLSVESALLEEERRRGAARRSTPPERDLPTPPATEVVPSDEDAPDAHGWSDTDGRIEAHAVIELAESTDPTESSVAGTFETVAFPELLHTLAERRANGALVCVHPADERAMTEGTEPTKIVYFRNGVPVHVRSNLVAECLGQVLAHARKIGPGALGESLRAMRDGSRRQGEALVEMGAIGPLELSEALAAQMRLKLYDLFAWRSGTFAFSADRTPPSDVIDLEVGLAEIAFRGLSEARDASEIKALLQPQRDRYVIPQARNLVRFIPLGSDPALRAVIQRADGSRTLAQVLDGAEDDRAAVLLYAMLCLDAVRLEPTPLRARAPEQLPATPEAIADATPEPEPEPEPEPTASTQTSVSDVISSAAASEPAAPPDAPPTPQDTPAEALAEAAARAAQTGAQGASVHLAPAAPQTSPDVTRLTPFSPAPPRSPSEPARRDRRGSGLRSKADAALDQRVRRQLTADRRFRKGQRALKKDRPELALSALQEAVDLCPEEGQFLVHLAWARHLTQPRDRVLLEQCLFEAARGCKLSPGLPSGHLIRARLLLAAERPSEARKCFARVLELDPEDAEARRAIDQPTG